MTKAFELMMCGWGCISAQLDNVVALLSREYCHLVVRYPADQQLLLIMLTTRALACAGRACLDRVGFVLALARSQWYATRDGLIPYGNLAAE